MKNRSALLITILALFGISCFSDGENQYTITKDLIDQYRETPMTGGLIDEVIESSSQFIHKADYNEISYVVIEHHLIQKSSTGKNNTYFIFEYLFLEGVTCSIKAITLDENDKLLSIIRLANYEEYPDGRLNESTTVEDDFATRTTVEQGIQEYNDTLDRLTMKIDTTIVTYKFNQFVQMEKVDSVFKHYEYFQNL